MEQYSEKLIFGLDIGTRSVVGTVGYKVNAREFVAVAQAVRFHDTRAMLDGQIHDIAKVAETISEVRHELERKTGVKLTEVCIAAAGRVLKTATVRTDYDLGDEITINDELIHSMELIGVEKAHDHLRKTVKDKAEYFCVGYSVIKYYLGDIALSNLEGHKGTKIGADILATFLPHDVIDGLYAATDRAGLTVVNLTLEPIAAINVAIPERFRLLNLALVDVGAGTSDICITRDGSVTAYGMIPCAGDSFTEIIMQQYLVEFKTAESMKMAITGKKKKIPYKDIMGSKKEVSSDELQKVLDEPIKELTKNIADKIRELNGGKNVSAIFIVGGGGKNPEFTKQLAACAKLAPDRVALRGSEVLGNITFLETNVVKDPMLVTPIGICLNYYEQNNNFIFVKVNGELVKLYDNGHINVVDAAVGIGMQSDALFPKRGRSLEFTVNGERRMLRGESGESAVITINGKNASISSAVAADDVIVIKESTEGEAASATVGDLKETRKSICFRVDGKKLTCPRLICNRGEIVSELYQIQNGDDIEVLDYYTVERLFSYMDIEKRGAVMVNNIVATGDDKIYENFSVETGLEPEKISLLDNHEEMLQDVSGVSKSEDSEQSQPAPAVQEPAPKGSQDMVVYVNGLPVKLSGKAEYRLVDVLDFYSFDTSVQHGDKVVMRVNGTDTDFISSISANDKIELYWE